MQKTLILNMLHCFLEEIARQLENSGAKYIITIGMFLDDIRHACELYGGIEKIIVLGKLKPQKVDWL